MAIITINDVPVVPEVLEGWVNEDIQKRSNLFLSGLVVPGFESVPKLGYTVDLAIWGGIDGEAESAGPGECLTVTGLESALQTAKIQRAGKAIGLNSVVTNITGHDPLEGLTRKLSTFWDRQMQADMLNSVTGAAAAIDLLDPGSIMVAGPAQPVGFGSVVAARSLFGEYATDGDFILAIHSRVWAALQMVDAATISQPSSLLPFATYNGMPVIVSDSLAPTGSEYPVYVMRRGSFRYGFEDMGYKFLESHRDILCDNDEITSRRTYIIHPNGASFSKTAAAANKGKAPGSVLANPANWSLGSTDIGYFGVRGVKVTLA